MWRYVASDSEHQRQQKQDNLHYVIICEVTLADEPNIFYACSNLLKTESTVKATLPPENQFLSVTTADGKRIMLRENLIETAWPNNITGSAFIACFNEVDHTANISNISVLQESVTTCVKTTITVPVAKKDCSI